MGKSPDGDSLQLYYGAADTCVALAIGSIRALLDWIEGNGQSSTVSLG